MTRKSDGGKLHAMERWTAGRDETLRLSPGRGGLAVRVEEGLVLVTQAGDPADHVLGPGDELRLEGPGLGVAWAFEPSRAVIARPAPQVSTAPRRLQAA